MKKHYLLVSVAKPSLRADPIATTQWGNFAQASKDIALQSTESQKLADNVWLLEAEKDAVALGHIVSALGGLPFEIKTRLLHSE